MLLLRVIGLVIMVVCVHGDRYHPERRRQAKNVDAFNVAEKKEAFWRDEAKAGIEKRLLRAPNTNKARNVIMFLGDGMSVPTLAAARTLMGQRQGYTGEEAQLYFESFPTVGLAKTYCLDHQIADSACTATAYLSGVKNNYGAIGVTGDVPAYECGPSTDPSTHLDSIAAWALADGRDAGFVTTTRVTHASPAGTYARTASRYWESDTDVIDDDYDPLVCRDIAHQLIRTSPGNKFKVILGGGRREFLPNTTLDEEEYRGRRTDNRNLIQEWQNDKASQNLQYKYLWNRTELMSLMNSPPEYLLGLFEGTHLPYHLEATDTTDDPTLAEMTEIAIRSLQRNDKGFFLFVESGRIDHAHHDNYVQLSLDETIEMDLAVKKAMELLDEEDTLIVVTADHSHVMAFNGYTRRGSDILGPSDDIGDDGVPYMTLSYTNGPGARTHVNNQRVDVTVEEFLNIKWRTHAEIPIEDETHGGDDVAVFAIGPYHHMFSGLYEQSQIPHLMGYAACIGPGLHACSSGTLIHPLSLGLYLCLSIAFSVVFKT